MTGINTRPKRSAMRRFWHDVTRDRQLYVLILPAFLIVLFFNYGPIYGLQIAFRDFKPSRGIWGSSWVGLKYFARFLKSPNTWNYVRNTLSLSIWGVLIAFPLKIFLALVINEIASAKYKKFVQTVTYAPYFISITVLISMVNLLLAKNTDYVYTADPKVDPNAQPIPEIGYVEVIDRGLSVMDNSALTLCMDNRIPILVFGLKAENSIRRVACGERIGTIIH